MLEVQQQQQHSPVPPAGDGALSPSKHPLLPVESSLNLDVDLKLPLDDGGVGGGDGDIDFNGIDEDLRRFQTDDIVRQALSQGVDLRGYSRDIEAELREVSSV
jgi:hypothetical protein